MTDDEKKRRLIDATQESLRLQNIRIETYDAFTSLVSRLEASGINPANMKLSEFDSKLAELVHPSHFTNAQPAKKAAPVIDYEQQALDAKFAADMKQFEQDDAAYKARCETVKANGGIMPFAPTKPVRQLKRETTQQKLARGNLARDKQRESK